MSEAKKHHGMLFADRLMPPLLDGTKTQTRRPVKFKNPACNPLPIVEYARDRMPIWWQYAPTDDVRQSDYYDNGMPCPFGRVGDLIWARETWAKPEPGPLCVGDEIVFRANYLNDPHGPDGERSPEGKYRTWRPSIHMPKWACRCWLEITDVRVQRIQEISEEDALSEGSETRTRFIDSWSTIYPGSWELNDWVWALTFKRVDAPAA